ncbi:hypothetical protein FOA52_012989 [Chlamydomonas sp. UWO 241]|nr:hypothetical protein FOA52_012989 [Chlamydomonas sp. UWO 241]
MHCARWQWCMCVMRPWKLGCVGTMDSAVSLYSWGLLALGLVAVLCSMWLHVWSVARLGEQPQSSPEQQLIQAVSAPETMAALLAQIAEQKAASQLSASAAEAMALLQTLAQKQAASAAESMSALQTQMAQQQSSAKLAASAVEAMTALQGTLPLGTLRAAAAAAAAAAVAAAVASVERQRQRLDDDDSLCVVCMDAAHSATLMPCRHRVLCGGCCASVRVAKGECPMCRGAIQGAYTEWS